MKNLRVPVIRFLEFGEEWEEKKLGELTYKTGKKNKEKLKYPIYSINNREGFLAQSDQFEDLDSNQRGYDISMYKIIKENTFAYNPARINVGSIGYSGALYNIIISSLYVCFKTTKELEDSYLLQYLKTSDFNKSVLRNAEGGVRSYLFYENFSIIKIPLPSLKEQQKIATFLTAVDSKIQQLTKKKALLEEYKKGVMQRIFKQEVRFRDENGEVFPEWEERMAKEVFKSHSNKDHDGDLPILAITQDEGAVLRDSIGKQITSSQKSVKSYKIVEEGDFIISLRSFQGGIEYSTVMGICSPAYTILKPKIEIWNEFFKHYFKKDSFITRLSLIVVGIRDGKQISYEAFSGMKLKFPCIPEQQKIADFLSKLDYKAKQVDIQLEQVQQFKKGLLQKMFV